MTPTLPYETVLQQATARWVLAPDLPVVVSPDVDGFLSALLGAHHLGWRVCGLYDGRSLKLNRPVQHLRDLVFIDVEIYRQGVRSIGNHLTQWDSSTPLPYFTHCLNPNIMRSITRQHFSRKYPFATFHFLVALLAYGGVTLQFQQVRPGLIVYPDGTFFNILNYGANCKDWLEWLRLDNNPQLTQLFTTLQQLFVAQLTHDYRDLLEALRRIGLGPGPRGMQRGVTNRKQAVSLWALLQEWTGWEAPTLPDWPHQVNFEFVKASGASERSYNDMLAKNPLSFVLTSQGKGGLRYTLVPQDQRSFTD